MEVLLLKRRLFLEEAELHGEEKTQLSFETTSSLLCLSLCWTPIKFDIATLLFLSGARETIIFFFFQRPLLRQLLDNDDQQEFFWRNYSSSFGDAKSSFMGLAAGIGHTYWHFALQRPQIIPLLLRKIFALVVFLISPVLIRVIRVMF